jgi:hypothetical protein
MNTGQHQTALSTPLCGVYNVSLFHQVWFWFTDNGMHSDKFETIKVVEPRMLFDNDLCVV